MHYKWFPVYSLHTVHYKIICLLLAVYGYVQSQMKASCTPVPGLLNTHSTALLSPPSVTATSRDHPKVYKLNYQLVISRKKAHPSRDSWDPRRE